LDVLRVVPTVFCFKEESRKKVERFNIISQIREYSKAYTYPKATIV
jgi:hypothetical protein